MNSARPIPHLDHNGHGHDDGGGGVDGDDLGDARPLALVALH